MPANISKDECYNNDTCKHDTHSMVSFDTGQ